MIESKTLGSAAGVQRQDVIDNSETTSLPSLANGVITGRFKRGRMDKPFTVTAENYQALLGRDPTNPSYLVVEDAFKRGISQVTVMRTGSMSSSVETPAPFVCVPTQISFGSPNGSSDATVMYDNGGHARYRINGGEWEDYSYSNGEIDWYSLVDDFLTRLDGTVDSFGQIAPFSRSYGNIGYDEIGLMGVPSEGYIKEIYGEPVGPYDWMTGERQGFEVLEAKTTTIEFVLSEGIGVDLVQILFGGDYTAMSCGIVKWRGGE